MKKNIGLITIFLIARIFSCLNATSVDVFRERASLVVSLTGCVAHEVHSSGDIDPFVKKLLPYLEQLLPVWDALCLEEKDELVADVDLVSSEVLACLHFIKVNFGFDLYERCPEIFVLLHRFVQADVREVFDAVDGLCEQGSFDTARDFLRSIVHDIQERADVSSADKKIIDNLVAFYMGELEAVGFFMSQENGRIPLKTTGAALQPSMPGRYLSQRGRRNGFCFGSQSEERGVSCLNLQRCMPRCSSESDISDTFIEHGSRSEVRDTQLPPCVVNPESLMAYIAQTMSTIEFLVCEYIGDGSGASSSYDVRPSLCPLLDEMRQALLRARGMDCDPRIVDEFESRLGSILRLLRG